jgi:hypothetical protein
MSTREAKERANIRMFELLSGNDISQHSLQPVQPQWASKRRRITVSEEPVSEEPVSEEPVSEEPVSEEPEMNVALMLMKVKSDEVSYDELWKHMLFRAARGLTRLMNARLSEE